HAVVADDHLELAGPDAQVNVHRALLALVGMHHDVVAGLAHGRVDVEQPCFPEPEHVHNPGQRPPDQGHVLGSAGQHQTKLAFGARHYILHARTTGQVRSMIRRCGLQSSANPKIPYCAPPKPMSAAPVDAAGFARDLLDLPIAAVPDRCTTTTAASSCGGPARKESSADSIRATVCAGSLTTDTQAHRRSSPNRSASPRASVTPSV